MLNLRNGPCHATNIFPMSLGSMSPSVSHVDFKKRPCRPVEFRVKGPKPVSDFSVKFSDPNHLKTEGKPM